MPGKRRRLIVGAGSISVNATALEARDEGSSFAAGATTPLRRLVSSEDVAEAIMLFALGGRSITGQMLTIDNGYLLNVGQPLADAHQ